MGNFLSCYWWYSWPRLKETQTITRLDSFTVDGTSVSFNIEERTTIASAGTNILNTDQVADSNGETIAVFDNGSLAADNWLWLDISNVSGSVTYLTVSLSCTV